MNRHEFPLDEPYVYHLQMNLHPLRDLFSYKICFININIIYYMGKRALLKTHIGRTGQHNSSENNLWDPI